MINRQFKKKILKHIVIKTFAPDAPFLYPMKTSENITVSVHYLRGSEMQEKIHKKAPLYEVLHVSPPLKYGRLFSKKNLFMCGQLFCVNLWGGCSTWED